MNLTPYKNRLERDLPEGWRIEVGEELIIVTARPRQRMQFIIDAENGQLQVGVPYIEGIVDTNRYISCIDPVQEILDWIHQIESPSVPVPSLPSSIIKPINCE